MCYPRNFNTLNFTSTMTGAQFEIFFYVMFPSFRIFS
jgi:hypothetical protein